MVETAFMAILAGILFGLIILGLIGCRIRGKDSADEQ